MKVSVSKCLSFVSVLFLGLVCTANSKAFSNELIVNIDNPGFRRLVMAIPIFEVDSEASSKARASATQGSAELGRLLEFSGLFNIMSKDAYGSAVSAKVKSPQPRGLEGIDLPKWKGLGVESLTMGRVVEDSTGITLEIRTVDINKGELILGKRFTKVTQLNNVIRRYADLLLQAYTGKPGIFSTKIVFIGKKRKGDDKQVFISDFDGSNVVQVTKKKFIHVSPSWSPDGKSILYTSFESGNPDLYRYDLATKRTTKISGYKGLNSGGAFSPDGKLVALTGTVSGDADIYLTGQKGGKRKAFIRGKGLDVDPVFSPNGKWLAFVSGRFGNPHIFRANLQWSSDKSSVKVVSDKRLTYAGWYNATPAWAPASDKIAFAGYDKEIDRFDIFMMSPDGSNLERLTIRAGDNESPSWAPNGQMLVFHTNRMGTRNIKTRPKLYIMNRDGSGQRPLKVGLYEAQTPKWSPPNPNF